MTSLVLSILLFLEPGASAGRRPVPSPPPTIDWPDFFASVTNQGVVFSEHLKTLEGQRVRLRGFRVTNPPVTGGLVVTRIRFVESDPHGPGAELDLPYDAVGVIWRRGLALPKVPARPTIEGTLRLGNRTFSGQVVTILLEDAVPVLPARARAGDESR